MQFVREMRSSFKCTGDFQLRTCGFERNCVHRQCIFSELCFTCPLCLTSSSRDQHSLLSIFFLGTRRLTNGCVCARARARDYIYDGLGTNGRINAHPAMNALANQCGLSLSPCCFSFACISNETEPRRYDLL